MSARGLLLTLTEPPPGMEEEFNAWYDLEHLPERLSIPGFRSARRWVADRAPGDGKYLATYELDSLAILSSPHSLSFSEKPTPWSKRSFESCVIFKRGPGDQPGEADPNSAARALYMSLDSTKKPPKALPARSLRAASGKPIVLNDMAEPQPGA